MTSTPSELTYKQLGLEVVGDSVGVEVVGSSSCLLQSSEICMPENVRNITTVFSSTTAMSHVLHFILWTEERGELSISLGMGSYTRGAGGGMLLEGSYVNVEGVEDAGRGDGQTVL
jgi:hypothetical protein